MDVVVAFVSAVKHCSVVNWVDFQQWQFCLFVTFHGNCFPFDSCQRFTNNSEHVTCFLSTFKIVEHINTQQIHWTSRVINRTFCSPIDPTIISGCRVKICSTNTNFDNFGTMDTSNINVMPDHTIIKEGLGLENMLFVVTSIHNTVIVTKMGVSTCALCAFLQLCCYFYLITKTGAHDSVDFTKIFYTVRG